MSLMRTSLSNQVVSELQSYLECGYGINPPREDLFKIVDNNLGFIVDLIEEQAVEVSVI